MGFRDELYDRYCPLLKRLMKRGAAVLEIEGAFKLGESRHLSERLNDFVSLYVSVDVAEAVKGVKRTEKHECLRVDCRRLPFTEGSFDLVHVTFPSRVESFCQEGRWLYTTFAQTQLKESIEGIAELLKKGGCVVVYPFFTGRRGSGEDAGWQERLVEAFRRQGFGVLREELLGETQAAIFKKNDTVARPAP